MNKIRRLPGVAEAEREACEWFARLLADDVTPEDHASFEAWRTASPRHARAYEDIAGTMSEVQRAGRLVRAVSFGNAMDAASRPLRAERVRKTAALGLAAAAAVALMFITTASWVTRTAPQTLFQTSIGEHASVDLPDGSRLELNSNSVARVQYTDHARTIRLAQGEAFFKVAHDPQRPFWVVAGKSWIRAVGTAFNVDLRSSVVRVVVSEGTVKVAASRPSGEAPSDVALAREPVSILNAGQQAEVKAGTAEIRSVTPVELTRLAAWRKGTLYFENQHLATVVDELGRYTSARIIIEDEQLGSLPIGGTFDANSRGVDALLNMLHEGFGLRVRRERDDRIYIEEEASDPQ